MGIYCKFLHTGAFILWGFYYARRFRRKADSTAIKRATERLATHRRTIAAYRAKSRHFKNESSVYRGNSGAYAFVIFMVVYSWLKNVIRYLALLCLPPFFSTGVQSESLRIISMRASGHNHHYPKMLVIRLGS